MKRAQMNLVSSILRFPHFVGTAGFEPATPCTPSKCASRAAPRPEEKSRSLNFLPVKKHYINRLITNNFGHQRVTTYLDIIMSVNSI